VDSTNRRVEMLLDNKNVIIYGAGGSIGGAVAKEFARQGASVFLTGRNRENLETVAKEITAAGGSAEVAVVYALDEEAVEEHARAVADQAAASMCPSTSSPAETCRGSHLSR
jgi:NADP-dependent 3-hydroxy acid dehydrogenase YdfG